MNRLRWASILVALAGSVSVLAQPAVNFLNARVKLDSNGYLLVSANAYGGTQGPATNIANTRVKVDSNGYLMTTLAGGSAYFADGSSTAPSIAFTNDTDSGWFLSAANTIGYAAGGNSVFTLNGSGAISASGSISTCATCSLGMTGRAYISSTADGLLAVVNNAATIGSVIKADALPSVASGFGTDPAVTAGSTPFAGSLDVGTGAPGTGGVINFNGTAFPAAPFVICMNQTTLMLVRCTATTTQLTIAAVAFTAGDDVSWFAASSK